MLYISRKYPYQKNMKRHYWYYAWCYSTTLLAGNKIVSKNSSVVITTNIVGVVGIHIQRA